MATHATRDPLSALLSTTPLDTKTQHHLRRVYSTLTWAVLLAMTGALLEARMGSSTLGWIAAMATLPALFWFNSQAPGSKNRPLAFYTFAFLDGAAAGPLIAYATAANPRIPLIAFAACTVVFAGFSVSALFAKRRSYLFLGSFLWTGLMGLLLISIVNMFTKEFYGYGAVIYGGLFLMCGFVLYDTQIIVEKVALGDSDHYKHAVQLLIDFMSIFKRLLIIFLKKDQERKKRDQRRRRKD